MSSSLDTSFTKGFNPEKSVRERRKLREKLQGGNPEKYRNVFYDEHGIHLETKIDMCDCLMLSCPGCFMPCKKCNGNKCGKTCRVLRKFVYDSIEYRFCACVGKRVNPLAKTKQ